MKWTSIRLSWAHWWYRFALCALWCFYRFLNLTGFRGWRDDALDLTANLTEIIGLLAEVEDPRPLTQVYNFGLSDGRMYTIMLMQVRGKGKPPHHGHV